MNIFILLLFSLLSVNADVCICQFPKEDSKFGAGYRGEIGFYKMGCAIWLRKEMECRRQKIIDINTPLGPYLDRVLGESETLRIGYVGHWSSSEEYINYLKDNIEPLVREKKIPVEVNNTACLSMADANAVQSYLSSLQIPNDTYIRVEGTQTTSIGMWDKVLIHRRKADLIAIADSRDISPTYPSCKEFFNRNCTMFQENETGFCEDETKILRKLICHKKIKVNKDGSLKIKKTRKWLFEDEVKKMKEL